MPGIERRALIIGLAALLGGANAHADGVYRWQDAQGNTVFSQRPPPGRNAELVKPRAGKPAPDSGRQLDAARNRFAPPAAPEKPAVKTPTPDEYAKMASVCRQAQNALKLLQENNRPRYVDESGKSAIMGDDLKASRTADARKKISEYCR